MRTVILEPAPAEIAGFLEQRRRLGQDRYDEVWEGEYHAAPAPAGPRAWVDAQLVGLLAPRARDLGLVYVTATNIGQAADYRVPDGAVLDGPPAGVYQPTALLVVEVVSPGDETFAKIDFYAACGVQEILVADPQARTVRCLALTGGTRETPISGVLGLDIAHLAAAVTWP